jgi:hypothetical protein
MLFTRRKQYEMSLQKRANDVEDEKEKLEKRIDILRYNVNKMIELGKDIIAVDLDKLGEPVIVYTDKSDSSKHVFLKDCQTKFKDWDFAILSTYRSSVNDLYIDDISGTSINLGYGTICMNYLQEIAHDLRVKKITGEIVNGEHIDRLKHFYSKNGFVINFPEDSEKGYIEWIRPYR